jgi:hypothetical protein
VTSKVTAQFWEYYADLPLEVRRLADKTYASWLRDPGHASLHFKKLAGHCGRSALDGSTVHWPGGKVTLLCGCGSDITPITTNCSGESEGLRDEAKQRTKTEREEIKN